MKYFFKMKFVLLSQRQGPKVSMRTGSSRGPKRVEVRVVSQGELLYQDFWIIWIVSPEGLLQTF